MAATLTVVTALAVVAAASELGTCRDRSAAADRGSRRGAAAAGSVRHPVAVGLYLRRQVVPETVESSSRASLVSMVIVVVVVAATAATVASFDASRPPSRAGRRHLVGGVPASRRAGSAPRPRAGPQPCPASGSRQRQPGGTPRAGCSSTVMPVDIQVFGDDGEIRPRSDVAERRLPLAKLPSAPRHLAEIGVDVGGTVALSLTPGGLRPYGATWSEKRCWRPRSSSTSRRSRRCATGGIDVRGYSAREEDSVIGIVLVDYDHDDEPLRTFDAVEQALGTVDSFETADRQGVTGLARLRLVPILLLTGLHLLVVAAVAHVLLVSVSSHRRDIAVLRVLGFTARQSWTSVTTEAVLVTLAACAVGVPLGVLISPRRLGPDRRQPRRRAPSHDPGAPSRRHVRDAARRRARRVARARCPSRALPASRHPPQPK